MTNILPPGPLAYQGTIATPYFVPNTHQIANPTTTTTQFDVPTLWIDPPNEMAYILVAKPNNVAKWQLLCSGEGNVSSLTGNSGGAVGPDMDGNINVVGDGTTITIVGNPGTNTLTASVIGGSDVVSITATAPLTANAMSGTPETGAVTVALTTPLSLTYGGTNASLTASNGGIFYSSATAGAILAGTSTAHQMLQSGASTTPAWSTATWPATTTINQVLYSSATNTVTGITAADNGVMISGTTGIPSWLANSGTPGFVLTANSGAPPSWQSVSADGAVTTLSDDVGTSITPSTGNIQLVGHIVEQGATKFSTVVAGTNLANINPMSAYRWIVDPLGFNGTHTTIAAAIAAATSGDTIFLLPGIYTENPTLKAGVNICANICDGATGNVTIHGKCTFSSAGTVGLSGVQLQTNGDYLLSVTGSAASVVILKYCSLICTNNNGIDFTSSSGSSGISLQDCYGDVQTTGITFFTSTASGFMTFVSCSVGTSGSTTTPSTVSTSGVQFNSSIFNIPLATTSTGILAGFSSTFSNVQPAVCVTTAGTTSNNVFYQCFFLSNADSCFSIGAGTTCVIADSQFQSSNTNVLTGAGTLNTGIITFVGTSSGINVTTVNKLTTYGGTII